jgi:hypothetical protein
MVLFVKAKEGLTRKLLEIASASVSGAMVKIPAVIDGPYGIIPNFKLAETAIFIAGKPSLTHCRLLA